MSLAIAGPMTLAIAPAGGPMRVAIGTERWGSRSTRAWKRIERVHLNPSMETLVQLRREQAA